MLSHKLFSFFCFTCFSVGVIAQEAESPGLGIAISQSDLAPWDISIETDGSGLPAGSGSVQQGEELYNVHCVSCHGVEGVGQPYDPLVGGHDSLGQLEQLRTVGSFWPYASTVYDYIRRAMPFNTPQSLSDDEVYSVTAYLFYLNGIVEEDIILNAETLSGVQMPNQDGFVLSYP